MGGWCLSGGTAGDHEGPPGHSAPPSPLREGCLPKKDGEKLAGFYILNCKDLNYNTWCGNVTNCG
jgi:hypothetical protein